jgi:hypothetical protein
VPHPRFTQSSHNCPRVHIVVVVIVVVVMSSSLLFDVTNFNEKARVPTFTTVPIRNLQEGYLYRIERARIVNTKFGNRILLTLKEKENVFDVFLPARFNSVITADTIEDFNNKANQLGVTFTSVTSRYANVSMSGM